MSTERTINGSVVTFGPGAEVLHVEPLVPKTENLHNDISSFVNPTFFAKYGGSHGLGRTERSNIKPGALSEDQILECPNCGTRGNVADQLSCGHVYCPECFVHMCASTEPPLRCNKIAVYGGGDICQKRITLAEVESRLGHEGFEDLLASSLKKYIRRNPTKFLNCYTPDCLQVMKRIAHTDDDADDAEANSPSTFTCNLCHATTCLTCETPHHDNMSCGDNKTRILKENADLALWKQENQTQDCPNCKCSIQIIDGGCLHITCEECGQHFCWKCMKPLDDGRHAYEHNKYFHLGHMP